MKRSHRCPKCQHGEILHVPEPTDTDFDRASLGSRPGMLTNHVVGLMEAYACLGCGLVEWYVQDVAALDASKLKGATVLKAPKPPPYR